jgi:hypothetical protein
VHRFNGNADASAAASADGARGRLAVTSTSGLKVLVSSLGPTVADADLRVTGRADRTAGAYLLLVARVVDGGNFYAAQINLNSNTFSIRKNLKNVWTTLRSGPVPATPFAAGTDYAVRLQVQGTTLRAKWWVAGQPEPSAWVEATDTSLTSGQSGVAGVVTTSSTTANFSFDDFVASPLTGGASGASLVGGASVVETGSALVASTVRGLGELWQRIRPRG